MKEVNQTFGKFQSFQHPSKDDALQPADKLNVSPAYPDPVFNTTGGTSPDSQPVLLTDRSIAPTACQEEGDYFLRILNSYALNAGLNLPEQIRIMKSKLDDTSLKDPRNKKRAGPDQTPCDFFLQREDLQPSMRDDRLKQCTFLGYALANTDNNTEAEKYAIRAYCDLRKDSSEKYRNIVYKTLFIIYDKDGELTLANSFLKKLDASVASKHWVTGMIALGMEDRFRNDCDPFHGFKQFTTLGETKRAFKTLEGKTCKMASNTDIGLELKHLWELFYPFLLPVKDINKALKYCSRLIASINKHSEYPEITYKPIERLMAITPGSPDYNKLTSILDIFNREEGKAFWKYVSDRITAKIPLYSRNRDALVFCIVASAIKESGIKNVNATKLLPDNKKNFNYLGRDLMPLFSYPFSFASQYGKWLDFLENAEKNESFAENNKPILDRGLAALPDKLGDCPSDDYPVPDWIYHSTAPSDWAINSIRYLFAIDLPKNQVLARKYAETFKKILPEKGAILDAVIYLKELEYQKAFDALNLPESNHPGIFLFSADLLRKYQNKIIGANKFEFNESIVSNYAKAGEKGLPNGYVHAAEFLMEKYPDIQEAWERAANYYLLAANNYTETIDQQRSLIMAELCQAEAELIKSNNQIKSPLLQQDATILDKTVAPEPQDPVSPGLELPVRPPEKVKTDQHDHSALPHLRQANVKFWRQMKQIYSLMENNELLDAEAALEKLKIPDHTESWIQAMVAQNKAWCGKLMLEERMFSSLKKSDQRTNKGTNCQSKALLTRSKLVNKGLQHLREGFKTLGIELQSLERALDLELEPLQLSHRSERQYTSLLSTLAHYYSLGGDVSMSRKLRESYRKLYTRSHEIRDRISV